MAKNKFNKAWLDQHRNDPYVKLAQKHDYRSRAAFKLVGIDEQDHLIKRGMTIVDLGSAPGSWAQVLRERLATGTGGIDGRIISLDLVPMEPVADVTFIEGDFREAETARLLEQALDGQKVDLVLSDMAPNLSGVGLADAARMQHLADLALEFAAAHLKPGGALLIKCFHGSGYSQIVEAFKRQFVTVAPRKPKASRDKSAEVFLLGRGLKANPRSESTA
jgi:23S rRNA (uridine2552-2'-O)-methyltransferase